MKEHFIMEISTFSLSSWFGDANDAILIIAFYVSKEDFICLLKYSPVRQVTESFNQAGMLLVSRKKW